MKNQEYDFYITRSVCVKTIEAYKMMEDVLEREQRRITHAVENADSFWLSDTKDVLKSALPILFSIGVYGKTCEKVHAMRVCMEEALPEVNELLARAENLSDQLRSDSYVEPLRPADGDNTSRNGGIVAFNYGYVGEIAETCDMILARNRLMTRAFANIINNCSSLLSGTDEDLEELQRASNRLTRIENYKEAIQAYAIKVEALDSDMVTKLKHIIDNEQEAAGHVSETAMEDLAAFSDFKDVEIVKGIAGKIFSRDCSTWSDAEANFIAQSWDYAIQNGQTEVVEMYVKELFVEEYSDSKIGTNYQPQVGLFGIQPNLNWEWDYWIKADTDKIDAIMDKLNKYTQGEAYYTLNRMKYMEYTLANMEADILRVDRTTPKGGSYDVSVTPDENGKLHVIFSTEIYDPQNEMLVSSQSELTISDLQQINRTELRRLGFVDDQIDEMKKFVVTDADVDMLYKLSNKEYEEVFSINPDELSQRSTISLTWIANQTVKQAIENQDIEQAEDFINGLLLTTPDRCPMLQNSYMHDYLRILSDTSFMQLDFQVELVSHSLNDTTSQELLAEVDQAWRDLYGLGGMWYSLDDVASGDYFYNLDQNYFDGTYTFQVEFVKDNIPHHVSDMDLDLGVYEQNEDTGDLQLTAFTDYDWNIHNMRAITAFQTRRITINIANDHSEIAAQKTAENVQNIYAEIGMKKQEDLYDVACLALKMIPGLSTSVNVIQTVGELYKNDTEGILKNGSEFVSNPKTSNTIKTVASIKNHHEQIRKLEQQVNQENEEYIKLILGRGVARQVYGKSKWEDTKGILYGLYNPYVIARLNTWSEKGMRGLLQMPDIKDDDLSSLKEKTDKKIYPSNGNNEEDERENIGDEEDKEVSEYRARLAECVDIMIYGAGSDCETKIYDMDPDIVKNAMEIINDVISGLDEQNLIYTNMVNRTCVFFLKAPNTKLQTE